MLGFFKSNYSHLEASLHDAFWDAEDPRSELKLLENLLSEQKEGPHLEIGSGSGRLLLPLLQKGYQIEGLEPSPDMNNLCREQASQGQLSLCLHETTLENFTPFKSYASALIPAFTFQTLDNPQIALNQIRNLLRPKGLLYLSVFLPWFEMERSVPEGAWYDDKKIDLANEQFALCKTRHWLDEDKQFLKRQHHYQIFNHLEELIDEQGVEQSMHYLWPDQLTSFLEHEDFSVKQTMSDFNPKLKADEQSSVITILAMKNALN